MIVSVEYAQNVVLVCQQGGQQVRVPQPWPPRLRHHLLHLRDGQLVVHEHQARLSRAQLLLQPAQLHGPVGAGRVVARGGGRVLGGAQQACAAQGAGGEGAGGEGAGVGGRGEV